MVIQGAAPHPALVYRSLYFAQTAEGGEKGSGAYTDPLFFLMKTLQHGAVLLDDLVQQFPVLVYKHMSNSCPGLAVGTRRWVRSSREILIPRSPVAGTISTNLFRQDQRQGGSLILYASNRPFSLTSPRARCQSKSLGVNSSSDVSRRRPSLMRSSCPARSLFQDSISGGGTSSCGRLLSDKNINIGRGKRCGYSAGGNVESGLPFSTSSSSTSEACQGNVDGAALLRRVATYIEEDPRAADKLGKVVSTVYSRGVHRWHLQVLLMFGL